MQKSAQISESLQNEHSHVTKISSKKPDSTKYLEPSLNPHKLA